MKFDCLTKWIAIARVAPVRERGLKSRNGRCWLPLIVSRSREGAWIEISLLVSMIAAFACRSREGAWIEISDLLPVLLPVVVAPVRERGLKFLLVLLLTSLIVVSLP